MSDRLGLVTTIKGCFDCLNCVYQDRANEQASDCKSQKPLKGRDLNAILAPCLYIACRQENKPRTVKEICSVAIGASKKEMGRAKEYIVKLLEGEMDQSVEMGTNHAADYMLRNIVNMRSLIYVAAAVVYIITQLSNDKKPFKDISVATRVAEGTINNSYNDLYPHLSRIIPSWFAKLEDLKNLVKP